LFLCSLTSLLNRRLFGGLEIYNKKKLFMNIELMEDIEIVLLTLKDGNIDTAIAMLEEIQEEYGFEIGPKIFPN